MDLLTLKTTWLGALEQAGDFIQSRPSEELGCLYHVSGERRFVLPEPGDEVVPHYGRPGGVLPLPS